MALTWKENYATIFNSNTWTASVEGYKITNVFGLAWNYYVAYTKFITGLDLTLDMGVKCEMFFADTYKVGYANETVFGECKRADLHNLLFGASAKKDKAVGESNAVVGTETTVVETRNESIEEHNLEVLSQVLAAGAMTQTVEGAVVLAADTVSQTATSIAVAAAVEHIITTALFNVNDSLEVL